MMNREEDDESPPPPDPPNIPLFPSIGLPPRVIPAAAPPSHLASSRPVSLPLPLPYSRIYLDHHHSNSTTPPPAPIHPAQLNFNIDWDHRTVAAAAVTPTPSSAYSQPLPSLPFSPPPTAAVAAAAAQQQQTTHHHHLLPFSHSPTPLSHFVTAPQYHPISVALQHPPPPSTSSLPYSATTHHPISAPGGGGAGAGPSNRVPLMRIPVTTTIPTNPVTSRNMTEWGNLTNTKPKITPPPTTSTGLFSSSQNISSTGMVGGDSILPPLSHMLSPTGTGSGVTTSNRSLRGGVRKRGHQHSCHLCPYRAHQSSDLKRHLATHQDLRPFRCPDCNHSFRQKAHLNAHRLAIHSRLKPHRCDVCSRTFAARSSLKRHVTYVHNKHPPFFCPSCPAQFLRAFDCSRHQATMHSRNSSSAAAAIVPTSTLPIVSNPRQSPVPTPLLPPMPQPQQSSLPVDHSRLVRSPSLPIRATSISNSMFLESTSSRVGGNRSGIGTGAGRGIQDTIEGLLSPPTMHEFGTATTSRSTTTSTGINRQIRSQISRAPSLPHLTPPYQGGGIGANRLMHRSLSTTVVGRRRRTDEAQEEEDEDNRVTTTQQEETRSRR